jgi:arylsulfatase A-like enzyme
MVEAMDTEIGRLLRSVDLATTTVIFVGDNGTPAEVTASPYNNRHAKGTPYEGGVRVPLLVAGAGVAAPGRVVERIVNGVDLYPTILELAGIDPAAALPSGTRIDGVSIVPYLRNQVGTTLRTFVYAEEFPDHRFDRLFERAIANCCYKLIEREVGSREFYDLRADPYETKNLLGTALTTNQTNNLNTLDSRLDALIATTPPP